MDVESRKRADVDVKDEDDNSADADLKMKPSYRSWKKKYRKMRVVFDEKMQENDNLHKLEQKALATARRLAIQKDRLLDLLLELNSSSQIPPEKRFDLAADSPASDEDDDLIPPSTPPHGAVAPAKSYKTLLSTVPHVTFESSPEKFPNLLAELKIGRDSPADPLQGSSNPPSFLTADDIDNYLYELDNKLNLPNDLPTMAPLAHPDENTPKDSSRDFALRNPVSVYNWLRKHAPKTFLQDGEHQDKEGDEAGGVSTPVPTGAAARRSVKGDKSSSSRGGASGTGGGRGGSKRGGAGGSRASLAAAAAAAARAEQDDDEDTAYEGGTATPTAGASKLGAVKRKRGVGDDDPGYRPKGGSSRPAKKTKRKSEGGLEGTPVPTGKKGGIRKSGGGDSVMRDD
ncbi:IEC3 subunit of the Ino80 complex, chromatin re-modelling-domain-containing protein [Cladorrhinum sp. PSN259]|nr:IEC3 subunit of the Ino80 complex, chromatin re-modelling-domain-containing protein [Cladorrhinum sp. PSN259]